MNQPASPSTVLRRIGFVVAGASLGLLLGGALIVDSALRQSGLYDTAVPLLRAGILSRKFYVEPLNEKSIKQHVLGGFIESLDPHSDYLAPQAYDDLRQNISGSYGGIGISAKRVEDRILVQEVQLNSPAFKSGLKEGDLITRINDKVISASNYSDVFATIRGPVGESVKLGVLRQSKPLEMSVVRAVIPSVGTQWGLMPLHHPDLDPLAPVALNKANDSRLEKPHSKMIASDGARQDQVLVIKSKLFSEKTTADTFKAIQSALATKESIKGIVLDLRDNPGGLVNAAVGLSSFFLKPDSVVVRASIRSSKTPSIEWKTSYPYWAEMGEPNYPEQARKLFPELQTLPMVVLINSRSASASEIVASAMKDWKRATIVGMTSFGKGSVQSFFPLSDTDGSIKITTSRYYSPHGFGLQAVGVVPDVMVNDPIPVGDREADIPGHLKSENGYETLGHSIAKASSNEKPNSPMSSKTPLPEKKEESRANPSSPHARTSSGTKEPLKSKAPIKGLKENTVKQNIASQSQDQDNEPDRLFSDRIRLSRHDIYHLKALDALNHKTH